MVFDSIELTVFYLPVRERFSYAISIFFRAETGL